MAQQPYGELGLILALVGILFAVGGAAIDTVLLGRLQPRPVPGLEVGQALPAARASRASRCRWRGFLLAGFAIAATGVDPIELTEYAVIFSILVLPLTYLPILLVGNDRSVDGRARQRPGRTRRSAGPTSA